MKPARRYRHTKLRIATWTVVSTLFGALPSRTSAQVSNTPGTVEGSLAVGYDGSASYEIPIQVPPGLGDAQPRVSLHYSSLNAENGPVGLGWALTGGSAIHRCGTELFRDNSKRSVEFTERDRLCLDGQRLVNVRGNQGDADYWQDGQEYRTAPESWLRVRMVGSCRSDNCKFVVTDRSGIERRYGTQTIKGKLTDKWLLDEMVDRNQNRVSYTYILYEGFPLLYQISYADHLIEFQYEIRQGDPDRPQVYRYGEPRRLTNRLSKILLKTNKSTFKTYVLSYASSAASQQSRLVSVLECDGKNNCLAPTTFRYADGGRRDARLLPAGPEIADLGENVAFVHVGDFNGDGKSDFLRQAKGSGGPPLIRYDSVGDGTFVVTSYSGSPYEHLRYDPGAILHVGDFNGDGVSDFLRQERGKSDDDLVNSFMVYFGIPGSTEFRVITPGTNNKTSDEYQDWLRFDPGAYIIPGDFDGDGLTDFLRQEHGKLDDDTRNSFNVYYSRGDGYSSIKTPAGDAYQSDLRFDPGAYIIPCDFNGDGKTDFIRQEHSDYAKDTHKSFGVYLAEEDGTFRIFYPGKNQKEDLYQDYMRATPGAHIIPGDFNGDGLCDFIRQEHSGWDNNDKMTFHVFFSRGDGNFWFVYSPTDKYQARLRYDDGASIIPGDFNGDGRTDFVRQERKGWASDTIDSFSIFYSRGDGTFDIVTPQGAVYQDLLRQDRGSKVGVNLVVADFNGDGKSDLLRVPRDNAGGLTAQVYLSDWGPELGGDGLEPEHLLLEVRQGSTTVKELTYEMRGDAESVSPRYTPGGDTRLLTGPYWAVASLAEGGVGLEEPLVRRYRYEHGIVDRLGRGFLGFEKVWVETPAANVVEEVTLRTDFPFHMRVARSVTRTLNTNEVLSEVAFVYETIELADSIPQNRTTPLVVLTRVDNTNFVGGQPLKDVTQYKYDAYGNVAWVRSQVSGVSQPLFSCTAYTNDVQKWRIGVPSQSWKSTSCTFDAQRKSCSCPTFLQATAYVYDDRGNLLSQQAWDSTRNAFVGDTYTYDALGRVVRIVDPSGVEQRFEYPSNVSPFPSRSVLDPSGKALSEQYVYDRRFGVLTEKGNAAGARVITRYDNFGRLIEKVSGSGAQTYREAHRLLAEGDSYVHEVETTEGGQVILRRHYTDGLGRLVRTEQRNADGSEVLINDTAWSLLGQTLRESEPYHPNEQPRYRAYAYDAAGRTTRVTEPNGVTTTVHYRVGGLCASDQLEVEMVSPENRRRVECRDGRGLTLRQIDFDEYGQVSTAYAYDPLGRLMQSEITRGSLVRSRTRVTYDSLGRRITVDSSQQGRTDFTYDAAGRLTGKFAHAGVGVDPDTYRSGGVLLPQGASDPVNCRRACNEDARCLHYSWVPPSDDDPESRCFVSYDRSTIGEPVSGKLFYVSGVRPEPAVAATAYFYDSAGRLAEEVAPDGSTRSFEYDAGEYARGQVTRMVVRDANGVLLSSRELRYDARGRVSEEALEISAQRYTHRYSYHSDDRPASVVYPDGSVLTYHYDAMGRLGGLSIDGVRYVDYLRYTSRGQPELVRYGNGVETSLGYDDAGRLEHIDTIGFAATGERAALMSKLYGWTDNSEIAFIDDLLAPARSQRFTYGRLGYLAKAEGPYGTHFYHHDEAGNLLKNNEVVYGYLTEFLTHSSRGERFHTDGRGRRVMKRSPEESFEYRYDARERLTEVLREGELVAAYQYDADGQRLERVDAEGNRTLYISGLYEVTQLADGLVLHTKYVPGLTGRTAAVTLASDSLAPPEALATAGVTTHSNGPTAESSAPAEDVLAKGHVSLGLLSLSAFVLLLLGVLTHERTRSRALAHAVAYGRRKAWLAWSLPFVVPSFFLTCLTGCQLEAESRVLAGGRYAMVELDNGLVHVPELILPGDHGLGYPTLGTHFFHHDHLGSTSLVTDATGKEIAYAQHLPFGELDVQGSSGADLYRDKFTGKEWDNDARLYYYDARYYDPATGTFAQADSEMFGSTAGLPTDLNRFAYAGNNPISYNDPSGHFVFIPFLIAAASIAAKATVAAAVSGAISVAASATVAAARGQTFTLRDAGIAFGIGAFTGVIAFGVGGVLTSVGTAVGRAAGISLTGARAVAAAAAQGGVQGFTAGFTASAFRQGVVEGRSFDEIDWGRAAIEGGVEAAAGAISGGAISRLNKAGKDAASIQNARREALAKMAARSEIAWLHAARLVANHERALRAGFFQQVARSGSNGLGKSVDDLLRAVDHTVLRPLSTRLVSWSRHIPSKTLTPISAAWFGGIVVENGLSYASSAVNTALP